VRQRRGANRQRALRRQRHARRAPRGRGRDAMLPTTAAAPPGQAPVRRAGRAAGSFSTYFRRIVKPQQMDFE
jgi:hypothetical protein